jgi:hypothetical protein
MPAGIKKAGSGDSLVPPIDDFGYAGARQRIDVALENCAVSGFGQPCG